MTLHDFDASRRERNREREPLQFKLGGETFTCLAVIPAGLGFDLIDAETAGGLARSLGYRQFLRDVLATDKDRQRFDKVIRSTDDPVSGEDLTDIVGWIAQEYAGRPTERSSDSSAGPQTNGRSSKPAKSVRARKASKRSASAS